MSELTLSQIREIAARAEKALERHDLTGGRIYPHATLAALCETALAAIAERDRLRAAIEAAEHHFDCESGVLQSQCSGYGKCDCWKSRLGVTRG